MKSCLRRESDALARGAIASEAEACEAEQHHRPRRGLRNRATYGEVETKAAGPIRDEIVPERQIDARAPSRSPDR